MSEEEVSSPITSVQSIIRPPNHTANVLVSVHCVVVRNYQGFVTCSHARVHSSLRSITLASIDPIMLSAECTSLPGLFLMYFEFF